MKNFAFIIMATGLLLYLAGHISFELKDRQHQEDPVGCLLSAIGGFLMTIGLFIQSL